MARDSKPSKAYRVGVASHLDTMHGAVLEQFWSSYSHCGWEHYETRDDIKDTDCQFLTQSQMDRALGCMEGGFVAPTLLRVQ